MTDSLLDAYWESLGENGVFLCGILANQEEQLQQLQQQNQYLKSQLVTTQNNVVSAASAAMAQNLVIPSAPATVTGTPTTHSIKPMEPNKFNRDQSQTDEFIRVVKLAIAVTLATFSDDQTKILYTLSFMNRGMAEVWANNKMQVVINGTISITTFNKYIKRLKDAFGNPD